MDESLVADVKVRYFPGTDTYDLTIRRNGPTGRDAGPFDTLYASDVPQWDVAEVLAEAVRTAQG